MPIPSQSNSCPEIETANGISFIVSHQGLLELYYANRVSNRLFVLSSSTCHAETQVTQRQEYATRWLGNCH
jgi:hypothetical protein